MHSIMREMPVFELIGETISSRSVMDVVNDIQPGEKPLSGDYSDATNQIESWVCNEITDELQDTIELTKDERIMVDRSLTEHIMELRDESGRVEIDVKQQTNGQLMGSILSFLWLCIANVTLVRMSVERSRDEEIKLEDLKAKINGDDCLFNVNKLGKSCWEHWGGLMGLNPSVGKVFYTTEFVTLNSRMYTLDGNEVEFISLGLLYGTAKSVRLGMNKAKMQFEGIEDIGVRNYWLMQACPKDRRVVVQKEFIHRNEELLKNKLLSGIDWFMPTWSGGLGLCDVASDGTILNPIYPGIIGNPKPQYDDDFLPTGTYKQFIDRCNDRSQHYKSRCALYNMVTNWSKTKFRPMAWSSMKLPENLNMYNIVQSRLPSKPAEKLVFGDKPIEGNVYDKVFGLFTLEAYFTNEDVHDKIKGDFARLIDNDPRNNMYIEGKKLIDIQTAEVLLDLSNEGLSSKKAKRKLGELGKERMKDTFEDEFVKRIKYNSKIWSNNIKVGCTKLADWRFLHTRTYQRVLFGEVTGKGCKFVQEWTDQFDPHINPIEGFEFDRTQAMDVW